MRESVARSDQDFIFAAPRKPVRAQARRREPGWIAHMFAAILRHPARILGVVLFAGVFTAIAINALYMQSSPHPAPIFSGPVVARPAAPPAPAPRPADLAAAAQRNQTPPVAAAPAPVVAPPVQSAPPARETAAPKGDAIGALLSGGMAPAPAAVDTGARVLAAQKALVKLGYVLKADGLMGGSTRKALEMFEQTRKLPVTGELNARTLRELAAQSGIAIP